MSHSILIAEDNRIMADVIRFNLQRGGFEVVVAADGRIALEKALEHNFDLIMTDYQMPYLSGEELCRELRQLPQYEVTPILLCSAKGYELDVTHLQQTYNIAHVLLKPFSPREVVQVIQQTMADCLENTP